MIDPLIRRADAADADQLRWLEVIARTALIDQRGGQRWLATHAERGGTWEATIESGDVFAAYIDDVVVGYLVATHHDQVLEIDDVFVHTQARELGFGDELLAAALTSGRAAGMHLLEGVALPGDRDTKNLYERAGIKARMIVVSTEL